MGGTLLNKRYIKRKVAEEDREEGELLPCEDDSRQTTNDKDAINTPRKRLKQVENPSADKETINNTHNEDGKRHVSFNALAPSIVSIDGLGSQIIERFRDSIWYTKKDYRTFWKDRVETVRVWHSLYGGIENDEYVARMLDDTFTIRGLENYVCDPTEAAENLDPKKNRYVQAVLRAQRKGPVDAQALHEEVKEITGASLRKAQALAILDAQAVQPMFQQSIHLNEAPKSHPVPNSPNSVIGVDLANVASTRKAKVIDKKLLEHMDEGERRKIIIEHRRNSMQLYQAEERRRSEMSRGRLSFVGNSATQGRRQSLSGVPSASAQSKSSEQDMRYGMIMRGHRDSLAMNRRVSTGAHQPVTLKQHPRPASLTCARDSLSLGPRPSCKQSLNDAHAYSMYQSSSRRSSIVAAHRPGPYAQNFYTMESRVAAACQQQRRDSVYGTMVLSPQSMPTVQMPHASRLDPSTYTEMIGGFPGMRRDSLAGHYEHSS